MQAAHEQHVIHRDLKPANVLLAEDGTPKITDFGLAKKRDEAGQTASGAVMGTPSYMAPEQAGGKAVGPLADVYALGAILYECLTGRPPFKAATALDTVLQGVSDEPVPPTQLQSKTPRDLETICLKCLHKEPGKRYSSAEELAEDLGRFLRGEPIQARPVGAVERGVKWMRRHAAVSALATAVLLALTGGVAVSSWFAYSASQEATEARTQKERPDKKAQEAETNLGVAQTKEMEATKAQEDAVREARKARAQTRRAEDARHAIQLDLALRAHEQFDYDRMGALLNEMRPEYYDT